PFSLLLCRTLQRSELRIAADPGDPGRLSGTQHRTRQLHVADATPRAADRAAIIAAHSQGQTAVEVDLRIFRSSDCPVALAELNCGAASAAYASASHLAAKIRCAA